MQTEVLIADHHSNFNRLIRLLLERLPGMTVAGGAINHLELMELIQVANPRVLLVDPDMPGLEFAELAEEMQSLHPDTGIIVLSMHASGPLAGKYLSEGARGFLLKDYMSEELQQALQVVAAGNLYVSPAVGLIT